MHRCKEKLFAEWIFDGLVTGPSHLAAIRKYIIDLKFSIFKK